MPPSKSAKKGKPAQSNVTFVNYELTKEQKEACKVWDFVLKDFSSAMDKLIESAYKVTLGYDAYNRCFSAFVVPVGAEHEHAGLILPGRGSTVMKAFKQACYKHYVLFDENWHSVQGVRDDDIDD